VTTTATATNVTTVNGLAANVITAAAIATNAIDADALAADAVTEIWAGSTAPSAATIADAVWDEAATGHTDAGKAGEQLWTDLDAVLVDTAEIGAAGAGLTAINLPDQTMNITGNLSGSVGSVTGAVGSVTGLTAADVGAIKTTTDKFVFTVANEVNANTRYVAGTAVTGTGTVADPWGP
jgi:hypothetical protein